MAIPSPPSPNEGCPSDPSACGDPSTPVGPPQQARRRQARQRHLERSWRRECDIDPLILRARLLRGLGSIGQAISLEQELLPPF